MGRPHLLQKSQLGSVHSSEVTWLCRKRTGPPPAHMSHLHAAQICSPYRVASTRSEIQNSLSAAICVAV